MLIDADWEGLPRKLLVQANRNGFLYVLDRTSGKFLFAKAFGRVTWAKGIGRDGRPEVDPAAKPDAKGVLVCPGAGGVTNWYSPAYNPETKLLYVATIKECDVFSSAPQHYEPGHDFRGSVYMPNTDERPSGALQALDPLTGETKWQFKYFSVPYGGALATAGGVVFGGDADGNFIALDARTGKDLWHVQLGAAIYSAAIAYLLAGRQYVVIPSGATLFGFVLPQE